SPVDGAYERTPDRGRLARSGASAGAHRAGTAPTSAHELVSQRGPSDERTRSRRYQYARAVRARDALRVELEPAVRRARRLRQRAWNLEEGARNPVHAVLHDQGEGHGSRAGNQPAYRPRSWRPNRSA